LAACLLPNTATLFFKIHKNMRFLTVPHPYTNRAHLNSTPAPLRALRLLYPLKQGKELFLHCKNSCQQAIYQTLLSNRLFIVYMQLFIL
jgi:hypothetical protein